ncbi:MAG: ribbon-helix-helix domain-containing protein [Alphaproteobacteria bacterium]
MGSVTRVRRNVRINDRRTSVMMELELWDALFEICERSGVSVHEVCSGVQSGVDNGENFTSALRVYIINYFRSNDGEPSRDAA